MSDIVTRQDQYFDAMSGGSSEIPEPITRKEQFYAKMAGDETIETPEPVTREEYWLHKIIEHGGGGSTTIEPLTVTENGSYSETGKAYSPVTVNVSGGDITVEAKNITANGSYTAPAGKAYSPVTVDVSNTYSAGDEGKVVSSGALVAQTSQTIDTNGTYDTTLKNSVTVNVPSSGSVIVGALRSDAERCFHDTYDKLLVQDESITIPAYTTTQTTLISANYSYQTVTLDVDNYYYYYVGRLMASPIYNTNTPVLGRFEYYLGYSVCELVETNPSKFKSLVADVASSTAAKWETSPKSLASITYWSSATAMKTDISTSSAAGVFYDSQTPTYNQTSKVLSIPLPALKIKGSTSMFTSTAWGTMTDVRLQHVFDVYRVPKTNVDVKGFNATSNLMHIADCIANGGTLT